MGGKNSDGGIIYIANECMKDHIFELREKRGRVS